ncbi:hypothetical protein JQV19_13250 [Sulfitobacter mediterraneus]|uniref:hypothetical protein n=1 Tax=Sulfitobacter mediterraneus TaxID=83219 RepID=UPI001939B2EE|nr:hypothetical protein [Sulfitobacter mediterraneus]MBM1557969.1 hypothetical protein [Sulfitobacter mediterraneus]MBM1568656.1 hypothetical protein [Sulfitobacter mediterraneus]MBM1573142.1 hypothetical protein [Sulfitobacter mediterraneus]MBM1576343.1 hypothetical protein [Sulfitobacter mediterraneus]MBM1580927.1 hypothetical protein [Sulfitobacter mediterraneus]
MEAWQKRQQSAERISKWIGIFIASAFIFLCALQTTVLSVVPFPKALQFKGSYEEFVVCFEASAKLSSQDGITSYRRDIKKPESRIRMAQVRGFLGPSTSRVLYVDHLQEGYRVTDGYYEDAHAKSRPVRKYDWIIVWLCGTGNF